MARFPIKDFKVTGYAYNSNGKLIEIQISRTGEAARYKITQYFTQHTVVYYGYWQEIQYDKNGEAFINDWSNYKKRKQHTRLYLYRFMRANAQPQKNI